MRMILAMFSDPCGTIVVESLLFKENMMCV